MASTRDLLDLANTSSSTTTVSQPSSSALPASPALDLIIALGLFMLASWGIGWLQRATDKRRG